MIHKYQLNGFNIVLDVNSGAIHVVSDTVYSILDCFENAKREDIVEKLCGKFNRESINQGISEIEELVDNKLLFSDDLHINAAKNVTVKEPVIKALCLLVAHDCNMKCEYCFAEEGEYSSGKRSIMSYETGKKAIDFLIKNSGSRKNLEVDFFGGEPLLNFEVVKEIVKYARGIEKSHNKNFRFTITTNGVLLDDEKLEYINSEMSNIVLSIDGRKETNDRMRISVGGQGTYDKILPMFKKTAESRNQNNYYVRGTFTRNNLDFGNDVLHLADLGFKQISIEPVVGDKNLYYTLREEDLPTIYAEYERLAMEIIKRNNVEPHKSFNFFHFMIDLEGGPCIAKRLAGCGAGAEYLAVTADGELFPCHQFTGNNDFLMGNLCDGITNTSIRNEFTNCNIYAKTACKNCFAKFYCSGGCSANAFSENNNINIPYEIGCELTKKRTECAIMIKAAILS